MSKQTRRRYSDEFKEEAVKLITEQKRCLSPEPVP